MTPEVSAPPEFVTSWTLFWTCAVIAAFIELFAWCRRQGRGR